MRPAATVDPTIRNQRYPCWRPVLVRSVAAVLFLGFFAWLFIAKLPPLLQLGLTSIGLVLACYSAILLQVLPWANPIVRLKLGDDLEANPGAWHYPPRRIREITFAPDPAEDYHDSPLPVPVCEVRIGHHRRGTFRLIVTEPDAGRLRDWAVGKGIVVRECDGYDRHNMESTHGT